MHECAVDRRLDQLRRGEAQVTTSELTAVMADGAIVVDTRSVDQRRRDGELVGAMVIDRNVLEWRLDPTSPDRVPEASYDTRFVVVCNEGYSSTLAAASLRDLGLRATDLAGGVQALLADSDRAGQSSHPLLRPAGSWRVDDRSAPRAHGSAAVAGR